MNNQVIPLSYGIATFFIIKGKSPILVDTGMNLNSKIYSKAFKKAGINPKEIGLIIITHGHSDHFAGIHYIKELTGAKVLCHKNAIAPLETGTNPEIVPRKPEHAFLKELFKGKIKNYRPVTPDIVIEKDMSLTEYGVDGMLMITPGHSDCSLSIVLSSGEAIIGDILVGSLFAKSKPELAVFANDEPALKESIRHLLATSAHLFYGAHGGPFTRAKIEKLMKKADTIG